MSKILWLFTLLLGLPHVAQARLVHSGGLHTQADLERMKVHVGAEDHP